MATMRMSVNSGDTLTTIINVAAIDKLQHTCYHYKHTYNNNVIVIVKDVFNVNVIWPLNIIVKTTLMSIFNDQ
jgi:hypothetical protein